MHSNGIGYAEIYVVCSYQTWQLIPTIFLPSSNLWVVARSYDIVKDKYMTTGKYMLCS
jgi:hypothetical protein